MWLSAHQWGVKKCLKNIQDMFTYINQSKLKGYITICGHMNLLVDNELDNHMNSKKNTHTHTPCATTIKSFLNYIPSEVLNI